MAVSSSYHEQYGYLDMCDEGFHAGYIIRELESLYNRADIVTEIKSRRTELLGHVLRMESNREPQKILDGKRSTGRPRVRWLKMDENGQE
jgi:hypothetical protein